MKYKVTMSNEDGARVTFAVEGGDQADAKREAWRAYRELSYRDYEEPPTWTHPIMINTRSRKLDPPTYIEAALTIAACIVLETPKPSRRNPASVCAYVQYALIDELADRLKAVGYDLDKARDRYEQIKKEKGLNK